MHHVNIYTDGSCVPNHGSGGYAFVLQYEDKYGRDYIKTCTGVYRNTTNNRMEMTSIIKGLQELSYKCDVCVYTDSKLITDMFNNHVIDTWVQCHFRKNGRRLKNEDLWKNLIKEVNEHNNVQFIHVKGHSGNVMNEACDYLAREAARSIDGE